MYQANLSLTGTTISLPQSNNLELSEMLEPEWLVNASPGEIQQARACIIKMTEFITFGDVNFNSGCMSKALDHIADVLLSQEKTTSQTAAEWLVENASPEGIQTLLGQNMPIDDFQPNVSTMTIPLYFPVGGGRNVELTSGMLSSLVKVYPKYAKQKFVTLADSDTLQAKKIFSYMPKKQAAEVFAALVDASTTQARMVMEKLSIGHFSKFLNFFAKEHPDHLVAMLSDVDFDDVRISGKIVQAAYLLNIAQTKEVMKTQVGTHPYSAARLLAHCMSLRHGNAMEMGNTMGIFCEIAKDNIQHATQLFAALIGNSFPYANNILIFMANTPSLTNPNTSMYASEVTQILTLLRDTYPDEVIQMLGSLVNTPLEYLRNELFPQSLDKIMLIPTSNIQMDKLRAGYDSSDICHLENTFNERMLTNQWMEKYTIEPELIDGVAFVKLTQKLLSHVQEDDDFNNKIDIATVVVDSVLDLSKETTETRKLWRDIYGTFACEFANEKEDDNPFKIDKIMNPDYDERTLSEAQLADSYKIKSLIDVQCEDIVMVESKYGKMSQERRDNILNYWDNDFPLPDGGYMVHNSMYDRTLFLNLISTIREKDEANFPLALAKIITGLPSNLAAQRIALQDTFTTLYVTGDFPSVGRKSQYYHYLMNCGQMH